MSKQHILMSVISLMPAALLSSQNPTPPQANAPKVSQQAGIAAASDTILATWLVVANENEIALANLALQQAQSKEVKQFAQQMIDDHGAFAQKLRPFAGPATATPVGKPPSSGSVETTKAPVEANGGRTTGTPAFDHQALLRELGEKCVASSTMMLADRKGAAFDHSFMQMQVGNHVMLADLIEVLGKHASTDLRPILTSGLATVRGHLGHAKTLCAQSEKLARVDVDVRTGRGSSGAGK
jgi:predicted outer membrane protein